MNLNFHSWRDYRQCPKKYFLKYRKKAASTVPSRIYYKIYGLLMEKFFSTFTNIWRFNTPFMPHDMIRNRLQILYDNVLVSNPVDWNASYIKESRDDIFERAFSDACQIMDSQNQNYFLSSKAETEIKVSTQNDTEITGRMDFIHTYPEDNRILIFDGKGTDKVGKNIDEDQLKFYALLYRLHYQRIPDEIGFFYYRFNALMPVDISLDGLNEFRARLSIGIKAIQADTSFKATPSPKSCKHCDYRIGCIERTTDEAKRRKPSKLDLPEPENIVEFSF